MPIKIIETGKQFNKYLMGTKIIHANLDERSVMVRVGGGYKEFKEYLKCEDVELKRLQIKVVQSGLTLDQVVCKMLNAARRKDFSTKM